MAVLEALQLVAWVLIVIGLVAIVVGLIPASRAVAGETRGWGVTLLILGAVMLLLVIVVPSLVG